ncbi:MAG: hypothetical protein ACRD0Y_05590 [Terriglobales bacterium]
MGTGARLGRAAAHLLRQRQRLQQTPMAPVGAKLGRAAGTLVGQKVHAHAQTPGTLKTAFRRGGRQLWAHSGNALRRLGLQISAVLFLFFAFGFGLAGYDGWIADRAHSGVQLISSLTQASTNTQIELALALVFAYFGISSWVRAAARQA